MSRKRFQPPEPPRPVTGAVMEDSLSRFFVILEGGSFQVRVKQLAPDGTLSKNSITLDLSELKSTGRKVSVRVEEWK
jgi:hypothetical protein